MQAENIYDLAQKVLQIPMEFIFIFDDYINLNQHESDELLEILDIGQNILQYKTYNLTVSEKDPRKLMVVITALHDDGYGYIEAVLLYAKAKLKSTQNYICKVRKDLQKYNEYIESQTNNR